MYTFSYFKLTFSILKVYFFLLDIYFKMSKTLTKGGSYEKE